MFNAVLHRTLLMLRKSHGLLQRDVRYRCQLMNQSCYFTECFYRGVWRRILSLLTLTPGNIKRPQSHFSTQILNIIIWFKGVKRGRLCKQAWRTLQASSWKMTAGNSTTTTPQAQYSWTSTVRTTPRNVQMIETCSMETPINPALVTEVFTQPILGCTAIMSDACTGGKHTQTTQTHTETHPINNTHYFTTR